MQHKCMMSLPLSCHMPKLLALHNDMSHTAVSVQAGRRPIFLSQWRTLPSSSIPHALNSAKLQTAFAWSKWIQHQGSANDCLLSGVLVWKKCNKTKVQTQWNNSILPPQYTNWIHTGMPDKTNVIIIWWKVN